jgi:pyruvate-formate lyase-activating enzyme
VGGPPRRQLILTVTRACNLRCSYCPTAKDGWPSLTPDDARSALRLFSDRFGGGDVKLFGGEPLLVPDVVRAAFEEAERLPAIRRVYLSTNGLGLDEDWLRYLARYPKGILTLSMDGDPADHRRFRRGLPGVPDTYSHVLTILPRLLQTPRFVVTQTIPPATADHAARNFEHLVDLGIRRFNLLPGYYLAWKPEQLAALREGLSAIADRYEAAWADGAYLYLRNLFTWAPTPFFNTGLVVDSDRTIHPSNVGLSGALDDLRADTAVGSLDDPPTVEELDAAAARTNDLLRGALSDRVWESTLAADAELSRMVRRLYPAWARWRQARNQAIGASA